MVLDFNEFDKIYEAGNDTKAKQREKARIDNEIAKERSQRKATKIEIPKDKRPVSSVEYDATGNRKHIHPVSNHESDYLAKKAAKERETQAHIDSLFTKKKQLPTNPIEPLFKGTHAELRNRDAERERLAKLSKVQQNLHQSTELRNSLLSAPDFSATILPKSAATARQNAVSGFMQALAKPGMSSDPEASRHIAAPKLNDKYSYVAENRALTLIDLEPSVVMVNLDIMMSDMQNEFKYINLTNISIVADYADSESSIPSFVLEISFATDYKNGKSERMSEEYLGLASHYITKTFGKFYMKGSAGYLSSQPILKEGSTKISGPFDMNENLNQTYIIKFKIGYVFKLLGAPAEVVTKDEMMSYIKSAVKAATDPRLKRLSRMHGFEAEGADESVLFDFEDYTNLTEQYLFESKCKISDLLIEYCCVKNGGLLVEKDETMCYILPTTGKEFSQKIVNEFDAYVSENLGIGQIAWNAFELNSRINIMISLNG